MSREVEVNNIKMTATVPEDFQLSLGKLAVTGTPSTAVTEATSTANSLGGSTGVLYSASTGAANDGGAAAPEGTWDWSNTADISAYYDIGRLIPASSHNGTEIFFTPDANGVGKTVKEYANYIKVTNKLEPVADSGTTTSYKATLHALTNTRTAASGADDWATGGANKYTQASAYNKTNDDGYYVDIPVWIRTSSNTAVDLSVDGYVIPGDTGLDTTNGTAETALELYRAVRVAILDGETVTSTANGGVACTAGDPAVTVTSGNQKNIIPLKDAWDKTNSTQTVANSGLYTAIATAANPYSSSLTSIVDSLNYKRATVGVAGMADTDLYGVSAVATDATTGTDGTSYHTATYTQYNTLIPTNVTTGTPDAVATVAGSGTDAQYGVAKKLVIRVWLDGEDQECWNDNAGQDWSISLRFSKIEPTT